MFQVDQDPENVLGAHDVFIDERDIVNDPFLESHGVLRSALTNINGISASRLQHR
jgi:hypothetical protein